MAAEPLRSSAQRADPLQVLVVDANLAARGHVQVALGEGYAVRFVASAQEAIAALRHPLPDLLVSEIDLPDENGLLLVERVRAMPECLRLPIMFLTGRGGIQDKVAGFQAGADDYVVKPVDPRLFFARVRLLCRIKGLERRQSIEA
ncbi:MAG: PleD family two-component system response regulator [Ktedonobacterales bacterium]